MNRFGWVVPATVILLGTALQSACGQAVDRTKDETPPETTADAVVTFYGSGDLWKSYVPGTKTTLFQGCIFDGEEKVGCLTFLGFLSVRLSPGVHIFSASLHDNHSVANSQMPVLLEAGKNYYLRAIQEHTRLAGIPVILPVPIPVPLVPIQVIPIPAPALPRRGRLDVVACDVAHKEAASKRPMPSRFMGKGMSGKELQKMPECAVVQSAANDIQH